MKTTTAMSWSIHLSAEATLIRMKKNGDCAWAKNHQALNPEFRERFEIPSGRW